MTLYTIKSGYQAVKFDNDLNHLTTYSVSLEGCSCPAGAAPTCRHREMLRLYIEVERVDSGWFLDWDKEKWVEPIATEAVNE